MEDDGEMHEEMSAAKKRRLEREQMTKLNRIETHTRGNSRSLHPDCIKCSR
jgi:hypothetical protein